jgi:hypothetical protein
MPITPYLDGRLFDPETKRIMGMAFECALAALRLAERSDPIVAIVAEKIVALAQSGETDPDRLCDQALSEARNLRLQQQPLFSVGAPLGRILSSLERMPTKPAASRAAVRRLEVFHTKWRNDSLFEWL